MTNLIFLMATMKFKGRRERRGKEKEGASSDQLSS
jgi:hypothetical protein